MLTIELESRGLTLPVAVHNARASWQQRHSVKLTLTLGDLSGEGEATPLPGHSSDDVREAERELAALQPTTVERALESRDPRTVLEALSALPPCAPSARFALQTAVFELLAALRAEPVAVLLRAAVGWPAPEREPQAVGPAELLNLASPETALLELGTPTTSHGVGCYKLKLGRDLQQELPLLQRWRRIHPPPTQLRIDFNRCLPSADVDRVLQLLVPAQPQFVEEPCDLSELGAPRHLPVPIAFDESLVGWDQRKASNVSAWLASGQVDALVLKPMLHGGLAGLVDWLHLGRRHATKIVISHLFDGAIAARAYAHWARAFGSDRVAMGLGSHPGLGLWSEGPHCSGAASSAATALGVPS